MDDPNPFTATADGGRFRFSLEFTRPDEAPQDVLRLHCRLEPFLDGLALSERERYALVLAAEELVLNVAKYGSEPGRYGLASEGREGPLGCGGDVAVFPERIEFAITDNGRRFDPNFSPPPPLDGEPEERPVGGLGLHMLKQYFSGVRYRREDGLNRSVWTLERA